MKIDFIPVNFSDLNDCAILAKWFNDPEINYLITPNFYQGQLAHISREYVQQLNLYTKNTKYAYFILADNTIIGDVNIIDNPEFLLKRDGYSTWLGITIGERGYRGLGIGKIAMNFIENEARELGFRRMELGVFEYNEKAIAFYKKLGYKQIGVVPRFTFFNGGWYDDLRFEKYL